jgi:hypothetical protein
VGWYRSAWISSATSRPNGFIRTAAGPVDRPDPGKQDGDDVGPRRPQRAVEQIRAFVLVGLANHAGPDGTSAFPSVATLVR